MSLDSATPARLPTYSNVVTELRALAEWAGPGNQAAIYFVGHGGQQPAAAYHLNLETDGLDEVFFLADSDRDELKPGFFKNALVDNEIGELLSEITKRGAQCWFVADCCHSGTLTRNSEGTIRSMISAGGSAGELSPAINANEASMQGLAAMFAAQPGESAIEFRRQNVAYGAFTYALVESIENAPRPFSYRAALEQATQTLKRFRFKATPMIEGAAADTIMLSKTDWPKLKFSLSTHTWTVDGGLLHGLTSGSILRVFEPFTFREYGYVEAVAAGALESKVKKIIFAGKQPDSNFPLVAQCEVIRAGPANFQTLFAISSEIPKAGAANIMEAWKSVGPGAVVISNLTGAHWELRQRGSNVFALRIPPSDGAAEFDLGSIQAGSADTRRLRRTVGRISRAEALVALASFGEQRYRATDLEIGLGLSNLSWPLRVRTNAVFSLNITNLGAARLDITLFSIDPDYGITPLPNYSQALRNVEPGKAMTFALRQGKAAGIAHIAAIGVRSTGFPQDLSYLGQAPIDLVSRSLREASPGAQWIEWRLRGDALRSVPPPAGASDCVISALTYEVEGN